MRILWLNWKDHGHPQAGGAEVVLRELAERLAVDGHKVTVLTAHYPGAKKKEVVGRVEFIRIGSNRYLHSFQALMYYLRYLRNKFDIVVEVVNTAPYFATLFGGSKQRYLFYHQLAREIWFHETKPPLSQFGYFVLEPIAAWLLQRAHTRLIAISESTKQDLVKTGFNRDKIAIISQGITMKPIEELQSIAKFGDPTILSFGSVRSMKRTLDHVKAFEIAKTHIPSLKLKIGGGADNPYGKRVADYARKSKYAKDISMLGFLSEEQKYNLMRRCHLTVVTSVKEGWCLTVTEAASQGTPAVVYNVDGLRDSVQHQRTGLVVSENVPGALAQGIVDMLLSPIDYERMRLAAWQWSKVINFDKSYQDFKEVVGLV